MLSPRPESEEGQAAIEFALAMPFLLMFLLFLVDLALLGFASVSVSNAVREGARCGAVGGTDAAVITRVENSTGELGSFDSVTIPVRDNVIGGDIEVRADYTYDFITPVGLVPGISDTLTFTKTAVMRMETMPPYTKEPCS